MGKSIRSASPTRRPEPAVAPLKVTIGILCFNQVDLIGSVIESARQQTREADEIPVSYTHLRAHETVLDLVCRLLLEKKNKQNNNTHTHTQKKKQNTNKTSHAMNKTVTQKKKSANNIHRHNTTTIYNIRIT